jgi:hypothetical protein
VHGCTSDVVEFERAEGRLRGLNDTFGARVTDIRLIDGPISTIRQIPQVFVTGSRDHYCPGAETVISATPIMCCARMNPE